MRKPIIVIGAGGHATVLIELLKQLGYPILGIVAPKQSQLKHYLDVPYLGDDKIVWEKYDVNAIRLVNGVGAVSVAKNYIRASLFLKFKELGYQFENLVHPFSFVASSVQLAEGVQIMAGVCIQPNTVIGNNSIINTGARIDHDCDIGENVHVAPNATLCGNIIVGNNAHIGVGSNIIQGLHIGSDTLIRAGETIRSNVSNWPNNTGGLIEKECLP